MPMVHYLGGDNREMNADELAIDATLQAELAIANVALQEKTSRQMRDALLASCDWTQTSDSPLTSAKKTAWATYRAALRNLPTADSKWPDHTALTWPTEPS